LEQQWDSGLLEMNEQDHGLCHFVTISGPGSELFGPGSELFALFSFVPLHPVTSFTPVDNISTMMTALKMSEDYQNPSPNTTPQPFYGPFFRDHTGESVPEENFWTLWRKGRLTEADTMTIRLGATPSGLTSAHLHHPPYQNLLCCLVMYYSCAQ